MYLLQSLAIAISMYSKIPVPTVDWNEKNMKYAMCFFPVVGAAAGGLQLLIGYLLLKYTSCGNLFFAIAMVLIPVIVSGGIHLDGFADTVDALSSYGDREKKLEILKDSHAGAFAVITACCYFLAAFGIWSELDCRQVLVLAGGFVLSRAMSGLGVASFPCAKKTGTLAMFSDAVQERIVMFCLYVLLFLAAGWMCVLDPKLGTAAVVGGWLVFFGYFRMSMKQFGGITGDLAGFFVQMCELVMAVCVWIAGRI